MKNSNFKTIILIFIYTLVNGAHNLEYDDLEALGVSCPERDSCVGYRNNLSYMDRSCECDFFCSTYKDCCIDAFRRRSSSRAVASEMRCLHYGENLHSGVYVISNCSSNWNGSPQVRQKCAGNPDMSDPLTASPVTNVAQAVTYKNLFCAECNNANMSSLKTFQLKMACDGLEDLTDAQILDDISFNQQQRAWGVYRLNSEGASNFVQCRIIFDVPGYLNSSVRFCRSNLISRCPPNWTRHHVKRACEEYMAVVYGTNNVAYRNPHCAICNNKAVDDVACRTSLTSRNRPMSFALLLDVNQSDGDQVGLRRVATPECPSGHKYDPFFKKCRLLVCALPGHVIMDGRCVRGG